MNGIADGNLAAGHDLCQDAEPTGDAFARHSLDVLEPGTAGPRLDNFDHRRFANPQANSWLESRSVQTIDNDLLAHFAWADLSPFPGKFGQDFGTHDVDLPVRRSLQIPVDAPTLDERRPFERNAGIPIGWPPLNAVRCVNDADYVRH